MKLLLQHRTTYDYPRPAALGPHLVRLRPATHARARVESYALHAPPQGLVHWQYDPFGNHVARLTFADGVRVPSLDLCVEMAVDIRPVNPFDFFVDEAFEDVPFEYPRSLGAELRPFLEMGDPAFAVGPAARAFLDSLPKDGRTVPLLVALNQAVNQRVRYVIREEPGIYTPEETLFHGQGSCRDFAVLLIAALRARGLAARFVSGYLIQLADEGLIPDEPRGVDRDVVDLHAWVEVYLPGAGWVGLDATSGLLCGEGHIPLAATSTPARAAPVEGTSDVVATQVSFGMSLGRLGHEPRPTAPYTEEVWEELLRASDSADARLEAAGLSLTSGGEPTFNSRIHANAPEWNHAALGPTKWTQGLALANELMDRLAPGGVLLFRSGKHYPGESLPRWAIDICVRTDGVPLAALRAERHAPTSREGPRTTHEGRRLALALAKELGLAPDNVHPAYEDPWRQLQEEARLPVEVDPLAADLTDSEERRRLARLLDRGLGAEVGFVIPLDREGDGWLGDRWSFRRGHLFLVPGDSPLGLRLPLDSLGAAPPPPSVEPVVDPPDPRRENEDEGQRRLEVGAGATHAPGQRPLRTALAVEARDGLLYVFLPPLPRATDFCELVAVCGRAASELGCAIAFEGYPPAAGPEIRRWSVTPDPGVLEVNVPPSRSTRDHANLLAVVTSAALAAGLHSEKYMLDGRQQGSGGGHHVTLGGPSPLESPFVRRPDLLASLITFLQHHPSMSFLFTGLFVGATSQAPRIDEARHDALYEMEIALERAFETPAGAAPAWLSDMLFRHLLVDVSGNTHRAEICIDKLFDWRSPHGRQGLVELRAFEMPPHARMAAAQVALLRAIVAAFADAPRKTPLVRWGTAIHDRFLLPYFLWRDCEDALAELGANGVPLPFEAYAPFIELRCPLVGTLKAGDVVLEIRNAIEPWHVLGEEPAQGGTSRFVDSSVERVEVRARGVVDGRHVVLVNGFELPLHPTSRADELVAGVRFRAWAPPHSLHAHLGIHHPLRFDVLDTWGRRSLGGCAYHVWHPEGRAFDTPPLTRFEASARRTQRFTVEGPLPWPVRAKPARAHPDTPYTLDLRRIGGDRPMPTPTVPD